MLREIKEASESSFLRIEEAYPNDFILVKIVEIDYSKGKETGIVLCVSDDRDELVDFVNNNNSITNSIILQGDVNRI